jgi:hypothetical protein
MPLAAKAIPDGNQHLGRHFQGGSRATHNPGLKPWAVLYSRFAAKSDSPPRDGICNQQSNIIQVSIWATTPKYNKLYTPEDSSVND